MTLLALLGLAACYRWATPDQDWTDETPYAAVKVTRPVRVLSIDGVKVDRGSHLRVAAGTHDFLLDLGSPDGAPSPVTLLRERALVRAGHRYRLVVQPFDPGQGIAMGVPWVPGWEDRGTTPDAPGVDQWSSDRLMFQAAYKTGEKFFMEGNTVLAEGGFRIAAAIAADKLHPRSPDRIDTLWAATALALMNHRLDAARELCEELLPLQQQVLGPRHAHTLRTRATLLDLSGFDEASADLLPALDSLASEVRAARAANVNRTLGEPEDLDVVEAGLLEQRARLRVMSGDLHAAIPDLDEAIRLQAHMEGTQGVGASSSLATVHTMLGHHQQAVELLRVALDSQSRWLGAEHVLNLGLLGQLAWAQLQAGDAVGARATTAQAERLMAAAGEVDHPLGLVALTAAGETRDRAGERDQAHALALRAEALADTTMHRMGASLPTARRLRFLDFYRPVADRALSGALSAEDVAALVWRWKGRALRGLLIEQRVPEGAVSAEVAAAREALAAARQALATAAYGVGAAGDMAPREEAVHAAESTLARALGVAPVAQTPPTLDGIRAALPGNAVLVEYLRYQDTSLGGAAWLALRVDASGVAVVRLGAAAPIDQAAAAFAQAAADPAAPLSAVRAAGARLERLVLAPVPGTARAASLVIAPDAGLHAVPFAAFPRGRDGWLVDQAVITTVGSAWELVASSAEGGRGQGALVVGDPPVGAAVGLALCPGRSLAFPPLPEARAEARLVATALSDSTVLLGPQATEAAVTAALAGKRVAHLATHAYYTGRCAEDAPVAGRTWAAAAELEPVAEPLLDPYLRSGILLAAGGGTDGVLTSAEILGLDLRGLELLVLSGCDTGSGDVKDGEGVMGLRHALRTAGVKSLILTLWPVSDAESRQLMADLYGPPGAELPDATALARAQRTAARRPGTAHPAWWAAFTYNGPTR